MHTFGTEPLVVNDVVRLSTTTETFVLSNDARSAIEANMAESVVASATGAAYGRTTGVGANRNVAADD
ncbi:MAG: hypothetical protein ACKOPB_00420, partial [Actinomycetota bacterium]